MSIKVRTLHDSSKILHLDEVPSSSSSSSSADISSIVDLPEFLLDCILQRLPPEGLCSMACVCSSLRNRCTSDHLWEKHMNQKWGTIIGPAAHRQWQQHVASSKDSRFLERAKQKAYLSYLPNLESLSYGPHLGPLSSDRSSNIKDRIIRRKDFPPVDSVMSWYLALESGSFSFTAQVYNKAAEDHECMLSCYDAEISYNPRTDTFQAIYPPNGSERLLVETGVRWDRVRAPPVDIPPYGLHISDCLSELQPGDHIEIQWRFRKVFPYGWWYGVVGHLKTCDGNPNYCCCRESDIIVVEFNHFPPGSRWGRTTINRKDHRVGGNKANGFYGGIRKLYWDEEISTWERFWPT